jgi:hypothetical protein
MSANPKLGKKDLPTSHNVHVFIKNAFIAHLNDLKEEIKVCFYYNRYFINITIVIVLDSTWKGFDDS